MSKKENYIVYKTTNLVNNKIYIGVHGQDEDPSIFDGYLGSGKIILHAIQKYGPEKFIRETLYSYLCPKDAYIKEKELVTEKFINLYNTYNLTLDGNQPPSGTQESYFKIQETLMSTKGKSLQELGNEARLNKYGKKEGVLNSAENIASRMNLFINKYGSMDVFINSEKSRKKANSSKLLKYGSKCGLLHSENSKRKALLSRRTNNWNKKLIDYPEIDQLIKLTINDKILFNSKIGYFNSELKDIDYIKKFRDVLKLIRAYKLRKSSFKCQGEIYCIQYN